MSDTSYHPDWPDLPPEGHPLRLLGARLADLLDEDNWNNCEALLMQAWEELTQAKAELAALHTELELLTHKLITCSVAASHPDANLAHTKAYAKQWNSPQAEDVRILRADRDALRAECERLRVDATVKAGRLLYIADNINDNVAVRFGLEAREDEIIAVMKDAGWPIDARKAQP